MDGLTLTGLGDHWGDIYKEARKSGVYFLRMPRDDSWNTHVVINGDSVIINDVE
ncbi:MAG: hypothetical protein L7G96_05545 [Vulcanisaeta sp.]|nr:hypothetical protein [Vulcanisaeta sp.]